MKNSYMHSDRVKQMEDIGVKVALGTAVETETTRALGN